MRRPSKLNVSEKLNATLGENQRQRQADITMTYRPDRRRRTYYWAMWCAVCFGEFQASRTHAFLFSPACRKKFSRMPLKERREIRKQQCSASWTPKNPKLTKPTQEPKPTACFLISLPQT